MRTSMDFPEETLRSLDRAAQRQGVSRAELVRRAVTSYLQQLPAPDEGAVFGMWRSRRLDALAYEDRLRGDWRVRQARGRCRQARAQSHPEPGGRARRGRTPRQVR